MNRLRNILLFLASSLLFISCLTGDENSVDSDYLQLQQALDGEFSLTVPALEVGVTADISATGAEPDERALLIRGTSLGAGSCPASLGGQCLGITGDVRMLARSRVNEDGVAEFHWPVPAAAPMGLEFCFQAFIKRGPDGVDSVLSDAVCSVTCTGDECGECVDTDSDGICDDDEEVEPDVCGPPSCPQLVFDAASGTCVVPASDTRWDGGLTLYDASDVAAAMEYTEITGNLYMDNTDVSSLALPNLRCVGDYLYLTNNSSLVTLYMPELESVGFAPTCTSDADCDWGDGTCTDGYCEQGEGYLYITGNTALPSFDFSGLEYVGDYVYIAGNDVLPDGCGWDLQDSMAEADWYGDFTNSGGIVGACMAPDLDGDGDDFLDFDDNCPTVSNPDQLDTDGDSIGDACECLTVTECPPLNDCTAVGFCDDTTGECVNPDLDIGTPCNDFNDCTQTDTCQPSWEIGGPSICVGSDPIMLDQFSCGPANCPQTYCVAGEGICAVPESSTRLDGGVTFNNGSDVTAAMDYTEITGNIYIDNTDITSIALPNLTCVGDYIYVTNNNDLVTLVFPALNSIGNFDACTSDADCDWGEGTCTEGYCETGDGYLYLTGNSSLPSFSFGQLTSVADYVYIASNDVLPDGCGWDLQDSLESTGWTGGFTNSGGIVGECVPVDLDGDADGLLDFSDNCPTVFNPDQLDTDADAIGDACECIAVTECPALNDCTAVGFCDTTTGDCVNPHLDEGTLCDDFNDCTQTDICESGSCVGTSPIAEEMIACGPPGCPQTYCEPGMGVCSAPDSDTRLDGGVTFYSAADIEAAMEYTEITGNVYMDNIDDVTSINLPNLTCVKDYIYITNNDSLVELSLPNLVNVGYVESCSSDSDCDWGEGTCLGGFCDTGEGYFYLTGNNALPGFKLDSFEWAGDYVYISGNESLPTTCGDMLSSQMSDAGFTGGFTNSGGAPGPCP